MIILDGYGLADPSEGNAIHLSETPFLDQVHKNYPLAKLTASGRMVGLPSGLMGNSEVGHLNLGAGRIVNQDITRIDSSIADKSLLQNQVILDSIHYALKNGSTWHILGLISDGGVHSSLNHLSALLTMAKQAGLSRVLIHAITDGRDTPPMSGIDHIDTIEREMKNIGIGRIASICGRYWTMDRDKRWKRVMHGYNLLVNSVGNYSPNSKEALRKSYQNNITDEFVEPTVIVQDGQNPTNGIRDNDSVFFFNFRADRAREISIALNDPEFREFKRTKPDIFYSTMTQYRDDFPYPAAFKPLHLKNILGEVLANNNLKQFRSAETEKYAHVTFFFNGGDEIPFQGEDRALVPSPNVTTYDKKPEMSALHVTEEVLKALGEDYHFVLINFANPDMVGHTGIKKAAIQALEALDPLIMKIINQAIANNYHCIITSDHGNCEKMIDEKGNPHTAHTTNKVPFYLISKTSNARLRENGILADVSPTILKLLNIKQPGEMTGKSLIW